MKQLIEAINNYQEKTGLSTCKLANKLGLHFATLYRLKQEKRGAGTKVLRALNQIPELRGAVNEFISGNNTPPASSKTSLGQNLRTFRDRVIHFLSRDIQIP